MWKSISLHQRYYSVISVVNTRKIRIRQIFDKFTECSTDHFKFSIGYKKAVESKYRQMQTMLSVYCISRLLQYLYHFCIRRVRVCEIRNSSALLFSVTFGCLCLPKMYIIKTLSTLFFSLFYSLPCEVVLQNSG